MIRLNETHDPALRSWIPSANTSNTDFPIQNLPFGILRPNNAQGGAEGFRGTVAIGDQALDLTLAADSGVFDPQHRALARIAGEATLNHWMAQGPAAWSSLRGALSRVLRSDASPATQAALSPCLIPQARSHMAMPAQVGDYTDFFTSIHHATNVGRLFRPDNPLLPNYRWVPIGYHGRSSSIAVSGQTFTRPFGQTMAPGATEPVVGPCKRLDFELELGIFLGPGNESGQPIPMAEAEDHLFGLCLLNDWSARDIQTWEYQPLGPFLAKNFATTISPWIVTLEALAPFRLPFSREPGEPQPLDYLDSPTNRSQGAIDLQVEALLLTSRMRAMDQAAHSLARTSYRHAYWTAAQLVAHHTVNGCPLRPGDLFGSGTLSGPSAAEACALLELSVGGKQPIALPRGESRTFLEDGDTVILRGWCHRPGAARIGFGECVGTVLPARARCA